LSVTGFAMRSMREVSCRGAAPDGGQATCYADTRQYEAKALSTTGSVGATPAEDAILSVRGLTIRLPKNMERAMRCRTFPSI
jgi:hypothetical protein